MLKALMVFNIITTLPLPIKAYVFTAVSILILNVIGGMVVGLSSVIITMTAMSAFFFTVLRIAKIRRTKLYSS